MTVANHQHARTPGLIRRVTARTGMAPIFGVVLILFWEFGVRAFEIWSSAIPAPSRILLEIWRNGPQLQKHASMTGLEALTGLLMAAGAALPLAVLWLRALRTRHFLASMSAFLSWTPLMALAPLMVIWFGYGTPPAAAISFLVCFSPMFIGFRVGLASLPTDVVEIIRSMGAGSFWILFRVRLPFCLPFATGAFKSSIAISLAGAVVAEFAGSDAGLGYLMFNAGSKADSTQLFSALSILMLMALMARSVISLIERRWIPWSVVAPSEHDPAQQTSLTEFASE